jgi:hypothetical protein
MADTKYEAAVQDSQRLDQELEIVQKGIELQQLRASELVEKRKKVEAEKRAVEQEVKKLGNVYLSFQMTFPLLEKKRQSRLKPWTA